HSICAYSIPTSLCERHDPNHVDIFPIVTGLRGDKTGKIQTEALFDVLRLDMVSDPRDVEREFVGGAKDSGPTAVHLKIDAQPLAPLAWYFTDIDHAGEHKFAVSVLKFRRLGRCGRSCRFLLPVEFQE